MSTFTYLIFVIFLRLYNFCLTNIRYEPLSGQVVVSGYGDGSIVISSVELFPRPPSDTCSNRAECSIPDLPQARFGHSLSLLSGGRLVVCGGYDGSNYLDDCISWVAGNTSWTHFYNMRCLPIIMNKPSSLDCCWICIQYLLNSKNNNNPSQSSSLSNTITARRDLSTRLGRRLHFPTPSSCSAAVTVQQGSLQRLCQVKNRRKLQFIYLIPRWRNIRTKTQWGGCMWNT